MINRFGGVERGSSERTGWFSASRRHAIGMAPMSPETTMRMGRYRVQPLDGQRAASSPSTTHQSQPSTEKICMVASALRNAAT